MTNALYAASGVNLEAGNDISSFAGRVMARTAHNNPHIQVHDHSGGHFRGVRDYSYKDLPRNVTFMDSMDGNGTKMAFNIADDSPLSSGYDNVAMNSADLTRKGYFPLVFRNQLDVSSLRLPAARGFTEQLLLGLEKALGETNMVCTAGETAEMGEFVGNELKGTIVNYIWSASATGMVTPNRRILGDRIAPGQFVYALREDTIRCNGNSAVRRALRTMYGANWDKHPEARVWIKEAAQPSRLYDRFLTELNGWWKDHERIPVTGIAHISGGGIGEKLGEILFPTGHSAELDSLFNPPALMRQCVEWLSVKEDVSDEDFYSTWNGGQGVLLIADGRYEEAIVKRARRHGITAKNAGPIVASTGRPAIRIHSRLRRGYHFDVAA